MVIKLHLPRPKLDFQDAVWADEGVMDETNCYTYALDCPEMGWARPGNLLTLDNFEYPKSEITSNNIRERIIFDGLKEISRRQALSRRFHAIALRIDPEEDYHFLRRNASGLWSHKCGDCRPRDYDDECEVITDPKTMAKYDYAEFGGYFRIPDEGLRYRHRFVLPQVTVMAPSKT